MVDGVGGAAGVLADGLVRLDLGAGGDLLLEPVLEGGLVGNLAGGLDAGDEGGGVVALGVGEVAEVEGGLDAGVGRGQVDAAARAGTGNVGGHAEGVAVLDDGVAQTLRVEGEGDLVAVHHHVGGVTVVAGGVGGLAADKDTGVRVHGGLALGHGLVELPHDDGLGVVDEVLTDTGNVLDDVDAEALELGLGAQAGEQHEAAGVDGAGGEDDLLAGLEGHLLARLEGDVDAGGDVVFDIEAGDPGVGEDGEVGAALLAAEDGVDVGDRGGAALAVVGVVGDVEEAGALGELALGADLVVEVVNDGDVEGVGAGLDPVLAELVAVAGVDGLVGVAEVIDVAHHGLKGPALAALGDPAVHVVAEGAEGDEGVVGGAAAEDLCARVADVGVAHGLLGGAIVVVVLAAEEGEPLAEVEDLLNVEVGGASLDEEHLVLGEVAGEARGQDAAGGATTDNDVVEAGGGGGGENLSSHVGRVR